MISRYTRLEMGRVWSDQNRFEKWLAVELAAAEALAEAGIVPARSRSATTRTGESERPAHPRNRGASPPRRHRVHDGGRRDRERSRISALAAFRV